MFYIDVRHINQKDISGLIKYVNERTTPDVPDANKIIRYFIPINGQSKIECLNPPGCYCHKKKKESDLRKKLSDVNDRLDRWEESMFPVSRVVLVEKSLV